MSALLAQRLPLHPSTEFSAPRNRRWSGLWERNVEDVCGWTRYSTPQYPSPPDEKPSGGIVGGIAGGIIGGIVGGLLEDNPDSTTGPKRPVGLSGTSGWRMVEFFLAVATACPPFRGQAVGSAGTTSSEFQDDEGGSSAGWRGKKAVPWMNPLEVVGSLAAIASANLVGNLQPWPGNQDACIGLRP